MLLADLHSASFGKKNEKLIRMIDKESPDLILMAGDMVVKNGKKLCVTKEFLTALSNKYPVYYSPGNHEIRMPDYEEYKNFLRDLGITYLENEQFSSIFSTFMYRMKALARLSLSHKGRMENTYNEHMAILNALETGDSEHIYEITIAHMERPKGINLEDL